MGKDTIITLLTRQLDASNEVILSLQDTIKDLRNTIQTQDSTIRSLETTIKDLERALITRDEIVEKAQAQMRGLKAVALPKKSEKQTVVAVKSEEEKAAEAQARKEAIKARGNNGAKRKEHFEIETVEKDIYPKNINEGDYPVIGTNDIIRYFMIPPRFRKVIYHIHKVMTPNGIIAAKAPKTPIHHSNFDGSFIAGMLQLRYQYSMPVERIVKYFNDHGFDICKQTAHGLIAKSADILEKLYKAMELAVKEASYINCDETYQTVLDQEKGSKKGYLWVIVAKMLRLCYFFYDEGSRGGDVIRNMLGKYSGIIQSDALQAYKTLEKDSDGRIVRLACLQHCKRKFLESGLENNTDAKTVVELCSLLYHKDKKHKVGENGWTEKDHLRWRREYAPPILNQLKVKLEELQSDKKYPPKSQMAKAVNYFMNEWSSIEAIFNYGHTTLDNNLVERVNRYVSISRRNSLFFGSHAGARRGCIFYSLACSCLLNKINFFDYISDILNRSASISPGSSIEVYRDLLPDRWTKEPADEQ